MLPGNLVKNFARFFTPLDHRLLWFATILDGPHQVGAILSIEFLILNLHRVYDLRTLCSKRNIEICLVTILTTSKFNDAVLAGSNDLALTLSNKTVIPIRHIAGAFYHL